jgi:hypothetical protein
MCLITANSVLVLEFAIAFEERFSAWYSMEQVRSLFITNTTCVLVEHTMIVISSLIRLP